MPPLLFSAAHVILYLGRKGTSMIHVRSPRYWKRQKRLWPVNVTPILTSVRLPNRPFLSLTYASPTAAAFPGGTKWYVALSPTLYVRWFADLVSSLRFCFWGCWGLAGNAMHPYVLCQTHSFLERSSNDLFARPPSLRLVPSLTTKRTTNIRSPIFLCYHIHIPPNAKMSSYRE